MEAAPAHAVQADRGLTAPTLRDIVPADLSDPARAAELHRQAVAAGLVPGSEAGRHRFFAAIERSRRVGREPCRLLAAILRRGLWHLISQQDEDGARRLVIKAQTPSQAPRIPIPRPGPELLLSRKPELVSPYAPSTPPSRGPSELAGLLARLVPEMAQEN